MFLKKIRELGKRYYCPFCEARLVIKNDFLFCPRQKIFTGKEENYYKWNKTERLARGPRVQALYRKGLLRQKIYFTLKICVLSLFVLLIWVYFSIFPETFTALTDRLADWAVTFFGELFFLGLSTPTPNTPK